ncbi:MAG: T9SS type A sorting domain-containing protein [Flavobacteriales bacterium]
MKNFILLITLLFVLIQIKAQPPSSRNFLDFGSRDLIHSCVAKTNNTGTDFYAVASTVYDPSFNNYDIFVARVDEFGAAVWRHELDIGSDDRVLDVVVDQFNNILITGYVGDPNNHELYVAKYDQNGAFLADFQLQVPNSAGTTIIESQATGDYYIGGYERGVIQPFNMSSQAILLKLNMNLTTLLWQANYTQADQNNTITDIVELSNQNLFITGSLGHDNGLPVSNGQIVLAAVIDPITGNVVPGGNFSFAAGHDHNLGASLAYDLGTDEVWLLFNSEFDSKPYVIGFNNVSSPTISMNPNGFYLNIPNSPPDRYAAYSILISPQFADGLTIFGYKDFTTSVGSGFALWGVDIDRYSGIPNSKVIVWNSNNSVPTNSIEYQGGDVLSLFATYRSSPYFHSPSIAVESVWGNRFMTINLDESFVGFTQCDMLCFARDLNDVRSDCMDTISLSTTTFSHFPELIVEAFPLNSFNNPNYVEIPSSISNFATCGIGTIAGPEGENVGGDESGNNNSNSKSSNLNENTIAKTNLLTFPNPATDIVTLRLYGNSGIKQVQLINAVGQIVFTKMYNESLAQVKIDVGKLPKGIYVLRVMDSDDSVLTKRVVKQ